MTTYKNQPSMRSTQKPPTFTSGELPFITGLYERARAELNDDENLSIDGVKTLLLETRDAYAEEFKTNARPITPHSLSLYLKYVRNLSLIERRMTPDLYTLITAARQIFGDQFAIILMQNRTRISLHRTHPLPTTRHGNRSCCTSQTKDILDLKNRLSGPPVEWRSCELKPMPPKKETEKWKQHWDPYGHCSWARRRRHHRTILRSRQRQKHSPC